MPDKNLSEIAKLLHQARKLLPEPPPIEDRQIYEIHRRILALEIETHNLAAKRQRATQKKDPLS